MKAYTFQVEILKHDGMDAAYITFPYDVEKEFGAKGQVKVKAIFDGHVEYRGSLAKMGLDCHCLGITKQIRKTLAKVPGQFIQVELIRDEEPRIVEVPEDVLQQLRIHKLENAYENLSYSKQKQLITLINSSKKEETRANRIVDMIAQLTNA